MCRIHYGEGLGCCDNDHRRVDISTSGLLQKGYWPPTTNRFLVLPRGILKDMLFALKGEKT
jgi:hypothetical protein